MKLRCASQWVLASAVATLLCSLQAQRIMAADTSFSDKPVSLNLQDADVRAALKALFGGVGANYSVDSDVHGTLSITMNNVGFTQALQSVMRSNSPRLTYDYTDQTFHIRVRPVDQKPNDVSPTTPVTPNGGPDMPVIGTPIAGEDRYYKLPLDHYDVARMLPYLVANPGAFVVPAGVTQTGVGSSAGGAGQGAQGTGIPTGQTSTQQPSQQFGNRG